jgi:hypothetical protein
MLRFYGYLWGGLLGNFRGKVAVARVRGLLAVSRVDGRTAGGLNVHPFATCQRILGKLHLTIRKSKQGMVPAHAYKIARMEPRATLPDDDVPWYHLLHQRTPSNMSPVGIR